MKIHLIWINLKIIRGLHSQITIRQYSLHSLLLLQDYFTAGVVEHRVVPPTNCMQVLQQHNFNKNKKTAKKSNRLRAEFHWAVINLNLEGSIFLPPGWVCPTRLISFSTRLNARMRRRSKQWSQTSGKVWKATMNENHSDSFSMLVNFMKIMSRKRFPFIQEFLI